jgi:hypothetical protein
MRMLVSLVPLVVFVACSSAPVSDESQTPEALHGCHGLASSSIPSDGNYTLTTFGGPSEPQPLSCGGASQSGSWYYAASKQRYGCGAHLRVEANGKCVVVQAADYGPDVCVETAAGMPILDASPLVGKALFGAADLGWSDRAKVHVSQVSSATPLGACSSSPPPQKDAGAPTKACSSDGDCNPGSDGAGLICVQNACVPGCHHDYQCPGNTSCVSGQCQ